MLQTHYFQAELLDLLYKSPELCNLKYYVDLCNTVYPEFEWIINNTLVSSNVYKLVPRSPRGIKKFIEQYRSEMYVGQRKNIPDWVMNGSQEIRRAFWDGMYDADGDKEKNQIMANGYLCLEKFIEITNTGKYDQFKNIIITNIKDPYAYKFDDKQGFFVTCNKTEVLNELINTKQRKKPTKAPV